ncbi:MAG TPA: hypothetical protein VES38_01680 [Methylotenera sp.]|nr:hypothetical protein [Methylotenera sp.]
MDSIDPVTDFAVCKWISLHDCGKINSTPLSGRPYDTLKNFISRKSNKVPANSLMKGSSQSLGIRAMILETDILLIKA